MGYITGKNTMAEPIINDPTKEIGYFAQRSGLFVAGKETAHALGQTIGSGIEAASPETARWVATSAGVAAPGVSGLVIIGLAAGVSSALTQMDYIHRKDNLKDLYKEELALKLKKPVDKITRADLDDLAKTNAVVDEELGRNRKQRNYGVALSFIASMASLAVVTLALPAALGVLMGAGGPVAVSAAVGGVLGEGLLANVVAFLGKGVVGLLAYHTVKEPLHFLADKLFGIDKITVNDHIVGLKRERDAGKAISREQVLSIFVAAHPEVEQYIVAGYGKKFDDLKPADKQKAAQELNALIPLDALTIDINSGKRNVAELAFAVQGDISGVDHHEGKCDNDTKKGFLKQFFGGMVKVNLIPGRHAHCNEVDAAPIVDVMQNAQAKQETVHHAKGAFHHARQLEQSRNQAVLPGFPSV